MKEYSLLLSLIVQISLFSVSLSVQCTEQHLTYEDEFGIFYEVKSAVLKH